MDKEKKKVCKLSHESVVIIEQGWQHPWKLKPYSSTNINTCRESEPTKVEYKLPNCFWTYYQTYVQTNPNYNRTALVLKHKKYNKLLILLIAKSYLQNVMLDHFTLV